MTTSIEEPPLRDLIEGALDAGRLAEARNMIDRLWREQPGPLLAGYVTSRHERMRDTSAEATRVFLLRSCTFEPVLPILRAQGFVNGLDLEVRAGDFNSHVQEILNPASPLYTFQPDVAILAVHTADVAPELWEHFSDLSLEAISAAAERVVSDFRTWIRIFRERSQAHLVVHDLELPTPAFGIYDARSETSQIDVIASINRALREMATEHRGVYVLGYDALVARHGRDQWHDARKWATVRLPLRADRMSALANEWLRFLHPIVGKVCKALVVDLDNTLWGGVVGEDGLAGIKVGKEHPGAAFLAVQEVIRDLYHRGVILAVCSKNNVEDAMEALENHPGMLLRPSHFAALKINWDDKARNLRAIAEELNIGIDSLAFMDDNPAERALVKATLPEVTVLELPSDPVSYARILRDSPVFERLSLSTEDRERGRYYAEERQRAEFQAGATSLEDFYRSLEIRVSVAEVTEETLARTSQLTQKTNQFNLTTRRYSEQQIAQMAVDPCHRVYTINAGDRFGDNGLVGVVIAVFRQETCEIDSLLLSCRVIGRTVETALLSVLGAEARDRGAKRLVGTFAETKKNAPCRDFFRDHGFTCIGEVGTETRWELDVESSLPECPPWIDCTVVGNGHSL